MFKITLINLDHSKFKDIFRNQSMNPVERAARACEEFENKYSNLQNSIIADLNSRGKTLNNKQSDALAALFKEKATIYQRLVEDYLHSQSRCASAMITGPANFNHHSNNKAINSSMNKYEKIEESCETWEKMAYRKIESLKNEDQYSDEFLREVIGQFQDNLNDYARALLKGKLERRAKHQNIDFCLDYLEKNINRFKITQRSIDKIRAIKQTTEKEGFTVLEIEKSEYFANRALVKSLGFRWNKVKKQWVGTEQSVAKFHEQKNS